MDIKEALRERHSVRYYKDEPISDEQRAELEALISQCNEESGLSMQLVVDDPECFDTLLAHYGMFKNTRMRRLFFKELSLKSSGAVCQANCPRAFFTVIIRLLQTLCPEAASKLYFTIPRSIPVMDPLPAVITGLFPSKVILNFC